MFKVIIAGSRNYFDYESLKSFVDFKLSRVVQIDNIEIVSGGANGADYLGEKYAEERGYALTIFKAKWDDMGIKAGIIRNKEMAMYADALIAFWDGKSRGTKNMIDEARRRNLRIAIKRF